MAGTLKVDTITNLASSGYITTDGASLDLSNTPYSIVIPSGGQGTRPTSPKAGSVRLNTTYGKLEYYNGTEWLNTDGTRNATQTTRYLVWTGSGINTTGDPYGVTSPLQRSLSSINTTTNGITYVPWQEFPSNWNRLFLSSVDRPWSQWCFIRQPNVERWIKTLCSPYANWTDHGTTTNSVYTVYPSIGSCIRVGDSMNWQHNNGGGESYDIPTLGNNGTVWTSGMYWGQIDSPGNYGGWMNFSDREFSGSGGGNTGDRLLAYIETDSDFYGTANDYVNYLTPSGPLGNAQGFPTSYGSGYSSGWGSVSNVFDATSRTTTSGWPSYGIQLNGNSNYIQVDLGQKVKFDFAFAIGYPGGSHWSNQNYIDASNDGSTWIRLTEWRYHNGTANSTGYLVYSTGSHVYENTINNMSKWIPLPNYPDSNGYRYYRLGGTNFGASNNYQLVFNWALLKRKFYS